MEGINEPSNEVSIFNRADIEAYCDDNSSSPQLSKPMEMLQAYLVTGCPDVQ